MTHAFSSTFFGFSLWLPENFGLFYCFSRLYVHSHRLCSIFPSGFRMFLDFFLLFLCFMSILTGSVPYCLLASGCFWTFFLLFSALCPFSPARFSVSLWLPDVFGLFPAFSVFYVHFLLPGSVFLSSFRMFLDFLLFFLALCPFSPALFRIAFWLPDVFGLFSCFSRLYVHFLLLGSVFLSVFTFILDFFPAFLGLMSIFTCSVQCFSLVSRSFWTFFLAFLCFMSIFTCSVRYFPLASRSFWTFSLFFSLLCPYGRVQKSPD